MRVPARVDLATRVLLDLAGSASPRTCRELALRAGVPASSLSGLLNALHRAEFVRAQRGRRGGYVLARDPELVTLADILTALDDIDAPFDPHTPLASVWDGLHRRTLLAADETTLADLVRPDSP